MPNLTPRLGLKKPLGNETVDISILNENADTLDAGIAMKSDFDTHVADTVKHITAAERTAWNGKLDATANLPASQVTQDSTHRFATDSEKTTWNGKQDALGFTPVNTTTYNSQINQDVRTTANPTFADLTITGNLTVNGGGIMKPRSTKKVVFTTTSTAYVNVAGGQINGTGRLIGVFSQGDNVYFTLVLDSQTLITDQLVGNRGGLGYADTITQSQGLGALPGLDMSFKSSFRLTAKTANGTSSTITLVYEIE